MHPAQFGGTIGHSTADAGMQLVYNIQKAWETGLTPSVLLIDISQFYPSVQQAVLLRILAKQGFHSKLCKFMADYLVGRETKFLFNGATTDPLDFSIGLGQGSSLSPILSGLYIAPVLHKWAPGQERRFANVAAQFFVDDGLLFAASPEPDGSIPGSQLDLNVAVLADMYHNLMGDLGRLGLSVESSKLELMHFRRNKTPYSDSHPLGPVIRLCCF
ncbi:uncharacterized protein FIBRA_09209 [Fibroporia radiculosa]|uniref:Reverse transcriptase domain-containing protein n=1 Tax=Fibroporia radiculosa TaxID=599839 RepID=J7S644_9APHY|nr:uncharacterized protein FIBRA_09209 [Fibroporia radiculosa]CCM06899.1 predicted protein [Fibroporia radiculosa]